MDQTSASTTLEKVTTFVGDKILVPLEELKVGESLANWMELYCQLQVAGGSRHTERAKRQDLQKFLWFYSQQLGHDQVRYWTPSLTRAFQKHLQTTARGAEPGMASREEIKKKNGEWQRVGKLLSATSINRILATLRHFAKWLHGQHPLATGNPMEACGILLPNSRCGTA